MPEFYAAHLTLKSQELYGHVKAWAASRGAVTVWGGWAVYELVKPPMNYRSRDVDIILHTQAALDDLISHAGEWGLVLDIDPLDRIAFLRFKEDPTRTIQVDLFTSFPLGYDYFGGKATVYHKPIANAQLLPPLPALLLDKVRTVSLRQGRDAYEKQAKDLLDIHRLAFHNREGRPAPELLKHVPLADRREAGRGRIDRCKKSHPGFEQDYEEVGQWLERP